ncbi:IS30 family transposase [Nocardiopsis metallicus]|uniref:IS30 family transposase n=1 Tax=Nocardiopsis metallicus TaxID=179819 RepID=A0A840WIF5_9ACTN|nr:IS30 family transposase [Nocardiopsis metallicus]
MPSAFPSGGELRGKIADKPGLNRYPRTRRSPLPLNIPVYFCDPASPWQCGSNENTNGLLRQYFPKSTDLSVHTSGHLQAVAVQLNGRPRKTPGWGTPAGRLAKLLSTSN